MSSQSQPWGDRPSFPEPVIDGRWSVRRSAGFAILSSATLWWMIVAVGQAALRP